jgi:hypothetical protein
MSDNASDDDNVCLVHKDYPVHQDQQESIVIDDSTDDEAFLPVHQDCPIHHPIHQPIWVGVDGLVSRIRFPDLTYQTRAHQGEILFNCGMLYTITSTVGETLFNEGMEEATKENGNQK